MIFLMLDPRYKSLCIISSFVRMEQSVVIVEEYNRKSLYPMLVNCHEHLHLLVRSKRNFADQNIFVEDYSLDIFEQIVSTSELAKELVKKVLLIFKFPGGMIWMLRTSNILFNGGKNMSQCFL